MPLPLQRAGPRTARRGPGKLAVNPWEDEEEGAGRGRAKRTEQNKEGEEEEEEEEEYRAHHITQ